MNCGRIATDSKMAAVKPKAYSTIAHLERIHQKITFAAMSLSAKLCRCFISIPLPVHWLKLSVSSCICFARALGSGRRESHWNRTSECANARSIGLQKNQRLICRRNLELMPVVVRAARQVIDVCQELFADRRWNCSSILLGPNYLADLTGGISTASRLLTYFFQFKPE